MSKPSASTFMVKVPTKTYLRKYVYAMHNLSLTLNYNSILGALVLSLLDRECYSIDLSASRQDARLSTFTDEIVFTSPIRKSYKGIFLTPSKIIAINRFLENAFVEDLYVHCRASLKKRDWRPGIEDGIRSFVDLCGIVIDTDVTIDALKKAEWRYRKRKEEQMQSFILPQSRPMQFAFC